MFEEQKLEINVTIDIETLVNHKIALVLFYSRQSGGSYMMLKIFKRLEKIYKNQLPFIIVDKSQHKKVVDYYNIHRVPTLVFLKEGTIIESLSGTISEGILEEKIKDIINNI